MDFLPVEKYEQYLLNFFEKLYNKQNIIEKYNIFRDGIINSEGLIAGGSVAGAYTGFESHDLDIYIHMKNAKSFSLLMKCMELIQISSNLASPYDQSFFRKNNILARYTFANIYNIHGNSIDIMVVNDNIPLEKVVTNFDLTFCEVWWDGRVVKATNPTDLLNKKGILRKEYVKSLQVYLNVFIINRIKKYMKRGFQISYETEERHIEFMKQKKVLFSYEEWMVKKILNYILHNDFSKNTLKNLATFGLKEYTIKSVINSIENLPYGIISNKKRENIEKYIMYIIYVVHIKNSKNYLTAISEIFNIAIEKVEYQSKFCVDISFTDIFDDIKTNPSMW